MLSVSVSRYVGIGYGMNKLLTNMVLALVYVSVVTGIFLVSILLSVCQENYGLIAGLSYDNGP